jgi:hypothetical protein
VRPFHVVLAAVLLLPACSALGRGEGNPNDVTVCVTNSTVMGTLRVWSDTRGRTHNVASGERQCRTVGSGGGEVRLYAETIGGGIEGPARGTAVVPNRPGECWLWDFRGFADNGNIVPCDFERPERRDSPTSGGSDSRPAQ